MADILYKYGDKIYANITNKCNCRCTFCIRFLHEGLGDADTLWHKTDPSEEEVLEAIRTYDFGDSKELVFCGYGEPTCALDILLAAAKCAKEERGLHLRLNTNGLGSLQNGRDIVPELAQYIDEVSISLNAPTREAYEKVTRPQLEGAYEAMKEFAVSCKGKMDVMWTVVDVLPEEQIEASRRLSEETGIHLRVRHYT